MNCMHTRATQSVRLRAQEQDARSERGASRGQGAGEGGAEKGRRITGNHSGATSLLITAYGLCLPRCARHRSANPDQAALTHYNGGGAGEAGRSSAGQREESGSER